MNATWFERYLVESTPGIAWSDEDRGAASRILAEISRAAGGEVFDDVGLSEDEARSFAVQRAEDAIQRRLNSLAAAVRERLPARLYTEALGEEGELTTPHQWRPMLDLNMASMAELEALPGIGKVLAGRILEHRRLHGPFRRVDQLKEVHGIDEGISERVAGRLFVLPEGRPAQLLSPELLAFAADPRLSTYTELVVSGGGFSLAAVEPGPPSARLITELAMILADVRQSRPPAQRYLPRTRGSEVRERAELAQRSAELVAAAAPFGPANAGLLFGDGYFPFVRDLLGSAVRSIRVIMFYMSYRDGDDGPASQLVDELIAAQRRGVDVQVILDRDGEGDVLRSRWINQGAFQALRAAGVKVAFDSPRRITHSKLVIVDDLHVVLGSHNWTKGSLQRYDDTSMVVASKALAEDHVRDFTARFVG